MSNQKFQNALERVPQAVPPIWFMRQAGRYHDHYQKMKEKNTFVELCKQPELAAEVALGPIEEFDFDVSILFSDLLFPLEALGIGLEYKPGPVLDRKLDRENIKNLKPVDEAIEALRFQKLAVEATRERLPNDKSLIGFVGGPWTLFTYAVEGSHKALMTDVKCDFNLYEAFCEKLVPLLIQNIQLQFDGGAEVVMVFDTAGGETSPFVYQKYLAPMLNKLFEAFPNRLGYYTQKVTDDHLSFHWNHKNTAGMGYDHRWDIRRALQIQSHGFVQGNFDQTMLFADKDTFAGYLEDYLSPLKDLTDEQRAGWVCGLGHGVLPKTPQYNVKYFVNRVREVFGE